MVDYKQIITIEPRKRGGKPCIKLILENLESIESFLKDENYGCFEIISIKKV